jgi:LacI family transcriptional regulator
MPTPSKLEARPRKAPRTGVDFQLRRKTSAPLYQQVQSLIHEHIAEGRLSEGDRLPSLKQLSDEMGIAYATVARGVRTLVENGVLEARAGSGTQVAPPSLHRLDESSQTDGKTGIIGYIGSNTAEEPHNFYYLSIVAGIESVAFGQEKRLMLLNRDSNVGWDKVDGILVQDGNPQRIIEALPPKVPCVCLLRTTSGVAGVLADDYNGARLGVRHLAELGHRRIAYLVQETVSSSVPSIRQRVNGFRDALHEAGIVPGEKWLHGPNKNLAQDYMRWGYQSMSQWLERDFKASGFTAVFMQIDLVAIGAIKALQEAGLRVPEDVSVLSFDGTPVCQLFSPTIAAVAVPLHRIGATAMELLARQISSGKASDETIILPPVLQNGESVAPLV